MIRMNWIFQSFETINTSCFSRINTVCSLKEVARLSAIILDTVLGRDSDTQPRAKKYGIAHFYRPSNKLIQGCVLLLRVDSRLCGQRPMHRAKS